MVSCFCVFLISCFVFYFLNLLFATCRASFMAEVQLVLKQLMDELIESVVMLVLML